VLVRISALSAFLILVLIAAGCGGGGSSSNERSSGQSSGSGDGSKTAFIDEADSVCTGYQAERQPIEVEIKAIEDSANPESPQNLRRLGELLDQVIAAAEVELGSLRELEPPQADEATIETMLDTAQEANGLGTEAAEALEEGETSAFSKLAKEIEAANDRAKSIAESYGLKVCGQAP